MENWRGYRLYKENFDLYNEDETINHTAVDGVE